jgi:hypothetical protein
MVPGGMAKKRNKADKLQRQTEQLDKRLDRRPDEIERKKTTPRGREPSYTLPPWALTPPQSVKETRQGQTRAGRKEGFASFVERSPNAANNSLKTSVMTAAR